MDLSAGTEKSGSCREVAVTVFSLQVSTQFELVLVERIYMFRNLLPTKIISLW